MAGQHTQSRRGRMLNMECPVELKARIQRWVLERKLASTDTAYYAGFLSERSLVLGLVETFLDAVDEARRSGADPGQVLAEHFAALYTQMSLRDGWRPDAPREDGPR